MTVMAGVAGVPYVSQFASPGRLAELLDGSLPAELDPAWASSGASDPGHYAFWAWRMCGMACLKMVLQARGTACPPLVPLAEECARHGGYVVHADGVDGLIYAPFAVWVGRRFGLGVTVRTDLDADAVAGLVAAGQPVIASVHPAIRDPAGPEPERRGGHLVLVFGVAGDGALVLHNPSGWPDTRVARADFARFFAGRGMVVAL
jgi:hypothetical protein